MKFSTYLQNRQPILWRTFSNALAMDKINHAYLLSGESGVPLKETALFLAKSILCANPNPLADEECRFCRRIEHGTYSDFFMLDGSNESIKKDDVQEVVAGFSKTPLEEKGILIYVIHLVENMTVESINSLLKFLEEPGKNTYAILTTQNEARILPTIISRCETIRMTLAPRSTVLDEAAMLNVPKEDAELLAYFVNSGELILEQVESDEYQNAKESFKIALESLNETSSYALYAFEKDIISKVSKKAEAKYFLDMLALAFKDIVAYKENQIVKLGEYSTLIKPLSSKLNHIEESLIEIMKVRSQLDLNISPALALEHVANYITKGR